MVPIKRERRIWPWAVVVSGVIILTCLFGTVLAADAPTVNIPSGGVVTPSLTPYPSGWTYSS